MVFFHSSVIVRLRGGEQWYPDNSFIILEPGTPLYYGQETRTWQHSWLICDGPFLLKLLDEFHIPCNTVIPLPISSLPVKYLLHLHTLTVHPRTAESLAQINVSFHQWMRTLGRICADQADPRLIPQWLVNIKHLLDTRYVEPITLGMLASEASLSVAQFCREFTRYYVMAPIEYLGSIRMHHAIDLLMHTHLNIGQISEQVGYQDVNYFSHFFRKYYGESPRTLRDKMRHSLTVRPETILTHEHRPDATAYERWELKLAYDFFRDTALDPRFNVCWCQNSPAGLAAPFAAPERVILQEQMLRLLPQPHWTHLRWEGELSEELKIDLVLNNTSPEGVNLVIALAGDIQTGNRLRLFGYNHVAFETVAHGHFELLDKLPVRLDPHAAAYHITLWRSNNIFYAELDGRRIMEYLDPAPPCGPGHRGFALARFHQEGSCDIQRLHVFARRALLRTDWLEPGRVLLRAGNREAARAWLQQALEEYPTSAIQQEARYLLALSTPDMPPEPKETLLQQVGTDLGNPFCRRALRELAFFRIAVSDLAGAVDAAIQLAQLAPADDTPREISEQLRNRLTENAAIDKDDIVRQIGRLPITCLYLENVGLTSLAPIKRMKLKEFWCRGNRIDDLTPLRGMPLEILHLENNVITNLAPLAGMPLRELSCEINQLSDIAPVAGMPLVSFACYCNQITDLTALMGMPLKILFCDNNRIHDLSPLEYLPLTMLRCEDNHIADLSPLVGKPLTTFRCGNNRITDLSPLAGMPLRELRCGGNCLTSLSALRGMPLEVLFCEGNPIAALTPLAGMPITSLSLGDASLAGENGDIVASLPLHQFAHATLDMATREVMRHLPSLRLVNGHTVRHVLHVADVLHGAWEIWREIYPVADPSSELLPLPANSDLRQFAVPVGECAYLAIPLAMPWAEAEAFCRWQRGRLAAPTTPEKLAGLHEYLSAVSECGNMDFRWHLDLPLTPAGRVCLMLSAMKDKSGWAVTADDRARYFIIEWT